MPKVGASWRLYGYSLNLSKQYKEAINILKKALNFDQNDPSVWFELGSAYERTGNYKKATASFRQVLSINPDDAAAANYLGYMWAEQNKNLDSAEILLEMALELDPENGAYLDSYGWIYYKKGNLEKAELYILKALEKIDKDPIIFDHLGDILHKKGDSEGALKAYQKCIELGFEDQEQIEEKIMKLQFNTNLNNEIPALHEIY
jgi:tetratricopeptide (TPR) repeat protein